MSKRGVLVATLVSAFVFPSPSASALPPLSASSATLAVYGGTAPNGGFEVLLFTWNSDLTVSGNGWVPGEAVTISLHGPLSLAPHRHVGDLPTRLDPTHRRPPVPCGFAVDPLGLKAPVIHPDV